jgi:pimeloyl-ACP methyl ester carboxylesterase
MTLVYDNWRQLMKRIVLLLVGVLLVGLAPPAAAQTRFEPFFEESPCLFDIPSIIKEGRDVVCGYVHVLEDHAVPDGPTIRLAVVIVKDVSASHRADPVLVLSGGPGQKTVQQAFALAQVVRPTIGNRDLILFDQRGVGFSEPALECPEFVGAQLFTLDESDPLVSGRARVDALLACGARLDGAGYHLAAYTTTQNAADVEDIRRALGYDMVNLYGGSYGSLLAQAVMRDHPDGIRSVIIDSVLPIEKSVFIDTATSAANAILHLIDSCAADPACNAAYPDLRNKLFESIDRLNADPLPITVTNPQDGQTYEMILTGDVIRDNLFTFLYSTSVIPVLPQAVYDVYNGDYALMTQLSGQRLALFDLLSTGMELSVLCTDDLIGRTQEEYVSLIAALPPQLAGHLEPELAAEFSYFRLCDDWPVEQADPSTKTPLVSDISTLVLAGEFDPITPPPYARLVASHLTNAYLYEFPGIGHGVIGSGPCATTVIESFLDDPTTTPDAACVSTLPGVVFDLPEEAAIAVVMEPVTYSGFEGLVPAGWEEPAPMNYQRHRNALDPTLFVQDAVPLSAADLRDLLAVQLGLGQMPDPVTTETWGAFTWTLYRFTLQMYTADLAITESDNPVYFVLLVTLPEEHDALYEQVFVPAMTSLRPIE